MKKSSIFLNSLSKYRKSSTPKTTEPPKKVQRVEVELQITQSVGELLNQGTEVDENDYFDIFLNKEGNPSDKQAGFLMNEDFSVTGTIPPHKSDIEDKLANPTFSWRLQRSLDKTVLENERTRLILAGLTKYNDLLVPQRSVSDLKHDRVALSIHIMNHVLRSRDLVLDNSNKIAESKVDLELRDQGYARCSVLLLTTTRHQGLLWIEALSKVTPRLKSVIAHKKFRQQFTGETETDMSRKPADYRKYFAGNRDDSFIMGIKVEGFSESSPGMRLKLFATNSEADIFICSPLGLVKAAEREPLTFLSSLNMIVCDQCHFMYNQNWAHLTQVMSMSCTAPDDPPAGFDLMRLREYFITDEIKKHCQLVCLSSCTFPLLKGMFRSNAQSHMGQMTIKRNMPYGLTRVRALGLSSLAFKIQRFTTPNLKEVSEARQQYFMKYVLEHIRSSFERVLIVASDYFEFVQLRRKMNQEIIEFEVVNEYSPLQEIGDVRHLFYDGKLPLLLTTTRFHFYHRYRIRGPQCIVLLSPPKDGLYFQEYCQFFEKDGGTVIVLASKYDRQSLSVCFGPDVAGKVISSKRDTFLLNV
ncbi:hypothetical protein PCE1_004496 [Barthelona sp. PCE]